MRVPYQLNIKANHINVCIDTDSFVRSMYAAKVVHCDAERSKAKNISGNARVMSRIRSANHHSRTTMTSGYISRIVR